MNQYFIWAASWLHVHFRSRYSRQPLRLCLYSINTLLWLQLQQSALQGRHVQQSDVEPFCYKPAPPTIPPMVPTEMTRIALAPKGGGENFWMDLGGGVRC